MSNSATKFVNELIQPLGERDIPEVLRSKVEDHRQNLEGLALSLASSGASEEMIRQVVSGAFASFEAEFTRTILEIRG
ncbi:hypothetical protein [Sphingomicrobium astaxanthinifaciens]|uniref:hypothetical protein n=1 Tax=Sphingomicrobium astaxanthinifaciens TaxID=1227949 RepID=UPI001FCC39B2|nr:hypothetical protein [Sphingomicrobium astaxanthinifaciens]MCJ7420302.1 hypothetical protein [Sphingomicrobium astaxanthinifaciens]